jgi:hypothetical protein
MASCKLQGRARKQDGWGSFESVGLQVLAGSGEAESARSPVALQLVDFRLTEARLCCEHLIRSGALSRLQLASGRVLSCYIAQ